MSNPIVVLVKEEIFALKKLISGANRHRLPRLRMLLAIKEGTHHNVELAAKTGSSLSSIMRWKKEYQKGGLAQLLADKRGGDFNSGFSKEDKEKIDLRLSIPTGAFTSFVEAHRWVNDTFGTTKSYKTVWGYLTRHFGASLKVGRKSHVNKEEQAVVEFKKKAPGAS